MKIETADMPVIRAEAGYEPDLQPTPIRFTGFLALLFGFLSLLSLLGRPLLILPLIAILLALVALRPVRGVKPIGRTAAWIGLVMAIGFGTCGFFLPLFKERLLGGQATYFGRQYLQVVANGHDEYVLELGKLEVNRSMPTTPLKELYQREYAASQALQNLRDQQAIQLVKQAGTDAEWVLRQSPRVFQFNGFDRVQLFWVDASGEIPEVLEMELEYRPSKDSDRGNWHLESFRVEQEYLVAESRV